MAVYLDAMKNHGKRIGRAGPWWCHMLADSVTELHEMADRIGMKRSWFQTEPMPHYDIGSWPLRAKALTAGATEVTGRKVVEVLRSHREAKASGPLR